MASKYPNAVQVQEAEEQVQRVNDLYKAEAKITVEYRLTQDDESLSSLMAHGRCELKYAVTGRARHPDEAALALEGLAAKIRK